MLTILICNEEWIIAAKLNAHAIIDFISHAKKVTPVKVYVKGDGVADLSYGTNSKVFGYFIKDIPGAMFCSGANCEYGLHHSKINPDEALLTFNANFMEKFIRSI